MTAESEAMTGSQESGDQSQLFVGNYDNGIIVTNIDDAITMAGQAVGRLAQKCVDVAPRAVHYLKSGDAAILYEQLPADFEEYYRGLYGFKPTTFVPRSRYTDTSKPLSLLDNILEDKQLLADIAREGHRRRWHITPFIQHPKVFELAKATGLRVAGMTLENVSKNRVAELNDKSVFQDVCRTIGIPVPDSVHARGIKEICQAADEIFRRDGAVMLRQALGAGGLGNILATKQMLMSAECKTLEEYIVPRMNPSEIWTNGTVLVEPVLKVKQSPATMMQIQPRGVRLISHSMQIIEETCYIGSFAPSGLRQNLLDEMICMARVYAEHVRKRGGYGYCGIDWGVLDDSSLVAFESNFRYGGMIHVNEIKRRLRPDNVHGVVTLSNDALKLDKRATFGLVHKVMQDFGLDWDPDRGEGVIVAIPPAGGSMGYVALAETTKHALALNAGMHQLALELPL